MVATSYRTPGDPTFFLSGKILKIKRYVLRYLAFAFSLTVLLRTVRVFENCVQNSIYNTYRIPYHTVLAIVLQSTQDYYASLFSSLVNLVKYIITYCTYGILKNVCSSVHTIHTGYRIVQYDKLYYSR